jgi:hypothetical protein
MADIESEQDIFDSSAEVESADVARDDNGRFAPKADVAEEKPNEQPAPEALQQTDDPVEQEQRSQNRVPVAEIQAERQKRQQFERDLQSEREARIRIEAQLQHLMASQQAPQRQEPTPPPDMFENPDAFLQHGINRAVGPIQSEIGQLREFYSQREAVREFGQETVKSAYDAIAQGMQTRDPETQQIYQRAMSLFDPYGEIVKWHQQKQAIAQVGTDPNAWFEKRLSETAGDPAGRERLLALLNGGQAAQPQARGAPLINLPSVNRASGGNPRTTNGPASEEDIFHAAPSKMGRQG